jgi:hypothetical protein
VNVPVVPTATEPEAVAEAAQRALARGGDALDQLILTLAAVDAAGDAQASSDALELLASMPRLVARLDERARRMSWWSSYGLPLTGPPDESLAGLAGPVTVALASTHTDGRIRERAVERMLAVRDTRWMPFLVLRTSDWVAQVRDRARAGLSGLLAENLHFARWVRRQPIRPLQRSAILRPCWQAPPYVARCLTAVEWRP